MTKPTVAKTADTAVCTTSRHSGKVRTRSNVQVEINSELAPIAIHGAFAVRASPTVR